MHDVSRRAVHHLVAMTGLRGDAAGGPSAKGGVSWSTFAELLGRAQRACGGAAGFREAVRSQFAHVALDVTAWAELCPDAPAFVQLLLDVLVPLLYPALEFGPAQRRDSSFVWRCDVPVDLEVPPELFELLAGTIEACCAASDGATRVVATRGGRTMHVTVSWTPSAVDAGRAAATGRRSSAPEPSALLDAIADARQMLAVHARAGRRAARGEADVDAIAKAWGLTARESSILRAISLGSSNKEIAASVGCSPRTVEAHLRSIFVKTGVSGRLELLAKLSRAS